VNNKYGYKIEFIKACTECQKPILKDSYSIIASAKEVMPM